MSPRRMIADRVRALWLVGVALASLCPVGSAGAFVDPAGFFVVNRSRVTFGRRAGRGVVLVDATFGENGPPFDPATQSISMTVGTLPLLEVPPDDRGMRLRKGVVTWHPRRLRSGRSRESLRVDLVHGRLRAIVRHFDSAPLQGRSPWSVPVVATIGDFAFSTRVDFVADPDGRAWSGPRAPGASPETFGGATYAATGRSVVVRDAVAWASLWAEHTGSTTDDPPAIDFSREAVAAVFYAGTNVIGTIDGMELLPGRAVVHTSVFELHCNKVDDIQVRDGVFARFPATDLPIEFDARSRWLDCR